MRGDETITFTDNMSFDGTERGGKMTTNGQLWIGSTTSRHVKLGNLISPDGSISIGYLSPNITLQVSPPPVVFSAYLSSPQSNLTGDSTNYFIIFNGILINTGGAYNPATGIFTAPVAGNYMFSYAIQIFNLNVAHSVFSAGIGDTSSSLTTLFSNSWANPFVSSTTVDEGSGPVTGYQSYGASGIIPLTVGQQVRISFQVRGGTKTVGLDSHWAIDNRTYFQGFLIR